MKIKKVPVAVAAAIMGKSAQFVRCGLRAGKLPFCTACRLAYKTYSYHISPKLFMDYTGCTEQNLWSDLYAQDL